MKKILPVTLLAMLLGGCSPSPESTVRDFYKAIENADGKAARAMLAESSRTKADDAKRDFVIAMYSSHIKSCDGVRSIDTTCKERDGFVFCEAILSFNNGNCRPSKEHLKLKQENGRWKIL